MSLSSYKKEIILFSGGAILLLVPLVRDFHFELAFLLAIVATFFSFFSSSAHKSYILNSVRTIYYAAILSAFCFIYALFSGCLSFNGVALWLVMVIPSSFLGSAISKLLNDYKIKSTRVVGGLIILVIALIIPIIEMLNFPQVYLFNHVWAYWPGPIYDEAISVSSSLLLFRSVTLIWILLLWNISEFSRDKTARSITILSTIALVISYTQLDDWNIISPNRTLETRLSIQVETKHFILNFDPDNFTEDEISYYTSKHEFYFSEIVNALEVEWPEGRKVSSYLYADAWQKKEYVGAKFTSYVPIWLERDQMHIAKQQIDRVLKHELVHVIAKQFGNALFNGSSSIGMIEGIATAVDKDQSGVSTLNQIVSAERPLPTKEQLKRAFSWNGFYGSSAGISYTTTGSFVEYMIDTLPIDDVKEAYRTGKFDHFPISFDMMYDEWFARVSGTYVDSLDQQVSERIFGQSSLFERECPHVFSKVNQLFDDILYAETKDDSSRIFEAFRELYELDSENDFVKTEWLRWQLFEGDYQNVIQSVSDSDTLLTHQILKADAHMLNGDFISALGVLDSIRNEIASSSARQFRYTIDLRVDEFNWQSHIDRRFRKVLPDSTDFLALSTANQMLSLQRAMDFDNDQKLMLYSSLVPNRTYNQDWFEIYLSTLDRLAYLEQWDLFDQFLEPLLFVQLRLRYKERLSQIISYQNFKRQSASLTR